jgi:hypothetical protein
MENKHTVLLDTCTEVLKWLTAKRDRPSLCGLGHEDYATVLIEKLEKAINEAEGK